MIIRRIAPFATLAFLAIIFGPSSTAVAQDSDESSGERKEYDELVRLSPDEIVEFEIEIDAAGAGVITARISVPGEVQPNADRLAHIVPRYAGIVTEVNSNIGDWVLKGDTLAVVEGDESLAPFNVVTMISGTVIEKHITLGEAIRREVPSFVIADLSSVWVDLTVYQRDLEQIRVGCPVDIYVGHEFRAHGTINYVTPVVDEKTRTATARLVLSNENGRWRPGMFVRGSVVVASEDVAIAVPRTALHTFENQTVVFVETQDGFVPRPVVVGRKDIALAEILEGLSVGDLYVSEGGFTLKAELAKESFGEGHEH